MRLKENVKYTDSTRSFLDDDTQIKAKRQLDDLTTVINKKQNLILGLRSLLRTFDAADLEQTLTTHQVELNKPVVDHAEAKAVWMALLRKVGKIQESRASRIGGY